jgi:hypothetical protein
MALAALGAAAAAAALAPAAGAAPDWMSEAAMRSAFIGKTLDGQYVNGERWTETYTPDGRLDYSESVRKGVGYWLFRGHVFCTFYDPGQGLNGGCFNALQPSSNCYEFYFASTSERDADKEGSTESLPGALDSWVARAWRKGEPSTCEARPIA